MFYILRLLLFFFVLVMASRGLEERALKKQRVSDLIQSSGNVSTRQLLRIVDHLKSQPEVLQYQVTRHCLDSVHLELHDKLAATPIDIDLEGESIDGKRGFWKWQFLDFAKSLDYYSTECAEFASIIADLYTRKPPTRTEPWNLAVYCDEATPGDPLRLDQRKKVMMVYASIVQFGPSLLKHEALWIPIVAVRANVIKQLPGGWSRMNKLLLLSLFHDDLTNLASGFPLACVAMRLVFCSFGFIIADEDALRQIWSAKGASGTFPCMECWNVCGVGPKSLVADNQGVLVDISCTDFSKFRRKPNAEVWQQVDELAAVAAAAGPAAPLKALEQKYGLNHNPHGLLLNVSLRNIVKPVDHTTHDPTHGYYSNGIGTREINKMLKPLLALGVAFVDIQACLSVWLLPKSQRNIGKPQEWFSKARTAKWNKTNKLSFVASEVVALLPLLSHFVERTATQTQLPLEVDSFRKMAAVSQIAKLAKRGFADAV